MPKIVDENGFVISWGRRTKKELDAFWASGKGGPPISSPSLSLSTKEMRSKKREDPSGGGRHRTRGPSGVRLTPPWHPATPSYPAVFCASVQVTGKSASQTAVYG
jgi:hypothetical protein